MASSNSGPSVQHGLWTEVKDRVEYLKKDNESKSKRRECLSKKVKKWSRKVGKKFEGM